MIRLIRSFGFALNGLVYLLRSQANARIHLAAALVTITAGVVLGLDRDDWLWLVLAIGLVWAAEAMNTAFEYLCDVVSPQHSEAVKRAKDIAAGAVVITAVLAVIIGCFIFLPHLI
ncbi:MAG: diacylglycerol kinase family protein [Rhodobacteraceae bacterium]|nr:diacylglycerol kinase family protein [Paracoccaceae bacterium]